MANYVSNGFNLQAAMSSVPESELTMEERINRSLQANGQYQAAVRGMNSHGGAISSNHRLASGGALTDGVRSAGSGGLPRAPQEIISQVGVKLGGIELSPEQAYSMWERGEVSKEEYFEALDTALAPYGFSA